MRIRDVKLQLWLSEDETTRLERDAKRCRMSKSAYVRSFINGFEPKAAPPVDYHRVLRELSSCGNNLNQLAHRANATGEIDAERYREQYCELVAITDELANTFLPQKRE